MVKSTPTTAETLPATIESAPSRDLASSVTRAEAKAHFIRASRSPRTRRAYKTGWNSFDAWCHLNDRQALPASPETITDWITDLALGGRAPATLQTYLAAVVSMHRRKGFSIDRKTEGITEVMQGIKNESRYLPRQVRPLMIDHLRDLIAMMDTGADCDLRDRALFALGFAAALRRAELAGLDWQELGAGETGGTGFVSIDDRGITLTLVESKTGEGGETVIVPGADMPVAGETLTAWIEAAGIAPGEPVFRPIRQNGTIRAGRLTDRSVARIIQRRIREMALAGGLSKSEAEAFAGGYSGHSLRAGFVSSAVAADVPPARIAEHTRHKSFDTTMRYVREQNKWTNGAMKGEWAR